MTEQGLLISKIHSCVNCKNYASHVPVSEVRLHLSLIIPSPLEPGNTDGMNTEQKNKCNTFIFAAIFSVLK